MAFWDELKEKITLGSQEAIQKTREIAEVVTTNANISESKKKISELYTELGEVLEDETADDGSHVIVLDNWREFYTKVRFIRSEEEVIAISEKKISELKAEGKCPSCGARIPKGGMFCPECGAKLNQDAPAQEPVQPGEQAAAPQSAETAADMGTEIPKDSDPGNE